MANIKSQIKRNKTNEKAHERNKAVKSELKTAVRRTRDAITAGDKAAAEKALGTATKKLDKAVSKGIIHQNQAANRKSAIAQQVAAPEQRLSLNSAKRPKARPRRGWAFVVGTPRVGATALHVDESHASIASVAGQGANGARVAITVTRRSSANTGSRDAPLTSASARAAAWIAIPSVDSDHPTRSRRARSTCQSLSPRRAA